MGRDGDAWDPLDTRQLYDALNRTDPVPGGLLAQLRGAFGERRVDTELARLVADESPEPTDDDGDVPLHRLRFESDRCTVTVEVTLAEVVNGGRLNLVGVVERGVPDAVVLETAGKARDGVVDGHRIRAGGLRYGPMRLHLMMAGDTDPWLVETEWTTL